MPDFGITAGDTSKTVYIRLRDSTTGLAKTGLLFNSAGASASYTLPGAAAVSITLATLASASAAWSSGGFILVSDTIAKGLYRLDLPDAAIASGDSVIISVEFDGVIEESLHIPLMGVATGTGLTALDTGTAQGGTSVSITLAAGASAVDGYYNFQRVAIVGGVGAGQSRSISDNPAYDGVTKIATVDSPWITTPDATSEYEIQAADLAMRMSFNFVVDESKPFPSTTTQFQTNMAQVAANFFTRAGKGRTILWTSGALEGQQVEIQAYELDGLRGQFTVDEMTSAPAHGDKGRIV